ncbi:poly-gamma-glutamate biosynthesis protein PgsC/CapC [Ramlibacter rhizophilus]|uniref:Capsule biosynthesis CapC n=1 Tax=Ramlibacter rhizophilus TaxID=1781167 RepID=A0A4Z0C3I4_9BURK|nr:poly-gamma-glutamate biosynthesis protein PgsC/CapC [Ramlibacter rhizophilus]TFZ05030.1 hypothetical protein EZ242_04590 [Ramlibacter rhizophilus]
MEGLALPLLPPALAGSVTVTVWLGAMIVAVSNLRLGWVLSGLVVPGYMVPLIIANPLSATVVFVEGVITYLVVWSYSEVLAPRLRWSTFFGRDRFFALVLVSVAVRLAGDGWLLPALGASLQQQHGFVFDYRNDLHSFGLIVVSLIANNFWKTGLLRGAAPMAVQVALTWLLVRFILIPLTNFNADSTAVLYEDIAASMLASPKAYIILIVTAFVASRLNLFYGWDFSGILIPSLLALQWYQPYKIVATFAEAIAILLLSSAALKLPYFRNMTMEGGRKLMLFFSVSLAYKFVVGWAMAVWLPQQLTSDYYGFGYLLATLIAIKAHDKNILGRLTQAVVQTSLAGVAVATLIGFVLVIVPDPGPAAPRTPQLPPEPERLDGLVQEALAESKTGFYRVSLGAPILDPRAEELAAFAQGLRLLLAYRSGLDPGVLQQARAALDAAGYRVTITQAERGTEYFVLDEREPRRHWGVYALASRPASRLLLQVPFPLTEPLAFEAATFLLQRMQANGFAAAPAQALDDDRRRRSSVLNSPQSIFQVFHREMASDQVLQVRSREAPQARLLVSGGLPQGLDLPALRDLVGPLEVNFGADAERNLQRETMRGSFSQLSLASSAAQRARLFAGSVPEPRREALPGSIAAMVIGRMEARQLPGPGSEAYRRRGLDELLRIEREVLGPVMRVALQAPGPRLQDALALGALSGAAASARALRLELALVSAADGDFIVLQDRAQHGGLVVLRVGMSDPYLIEVPRPVRERATLETAARFWSDAQARALVVAGAAADANADGSADVLEAANKQTFFQLAHQVLLRELGDQPAVAVQVRAMSLRAGEPPPADAVVAFNRLSNDPNRLDGVAAQLVEDLRRHGIPAIVHAGAPGTAGFGPAGGPQAAYMEQVQNKLFAALWVARDMRAGVQQESVETQRRAFEGLGIPVRQAEIGAVLTGARLVGPALPEGVRDRAQRYLASGDVVALSALQSAFQGSLERIEDPAGRGAFLLLKSPGGGLRAVLALAEGLRGGRRTVPPGPISAATAQAFLAARDQWLEASP